ncbi:hypothetical protein [Paenibacillus alkalitolerans]|uniref:hypothetical protein n=1 Tax=Paenibacillus alkalitolerans TaxID=2799335 RepID=UPI0018F4F953|nr:hypothetical protein [Paenibacillus alkalitolerans]
MDGAKQGEVILFPKTLDYYQIQLTKMLEAEAYGDAIRLLRFLLDCKTGDERTENEWSTLLEWLRNQFPDAEAEAERHETDEAEVGEEELLRRTVSAKSSNDRTYAKRLLDAIHHSSLDKQLLALDQLAYVEDPDIGRQLLQKLQGNALHPFVVFKLLQTLCKLGVQGEATFGKLGEIVTVDIEKTPLSSEYFPPPLPEVSERVQQFAEVIDPTLSYFANQTWREFLAYCYGNSLYRELTHMTEESVDVWAAALHLTVTEAMYGEDGTSSEVLDIYGITEMLVPPWEQACKALRRFFQEGGATTV